MNRHEWVLLVALALFAVGVFIGALTMLAKVLNTLPAEIPTQSGQHPCGWDYPCEWTDPTGKYPTVWWPAVETQNANGGRISDCTILVPAWVEDVWKQRDANKETP